MNDTIIFTALLVAVFAEAGLVAALAYKLNTSKGIERQLRTVWLAALDVASAERRDALIARADVTVQLRKTQIELARLREGPSRADYHFQWMKKGNPDVPDPVDPDIS